MITVTVRDRNVDKKWEENLKDADMILVNPSSICVVLKNGLSRVYSTRSRNLVMELTESEA